MKSITALVIFVILFLNLSVIALTNQKIKPDSYEELVEWYKELEKKYPNYIEIFKANELYGLGKVDGGYDLYYVRITNESNGFLKPEVLFLGSPHGDETAGTIGLYWAVKWLMENKDDEWIKWLLDNREIYIEVSHNPYGFDKRQRYDANNWDLNREADYDWKGQHSVLWGSVNGRTLWKFINSHAIRIGADFHGGARMLLYPWSSTHPDVKAKSPFSNKEYSYAPPDFYFYHTASLRLGEYIGCYGGALNEYNIGTIPDTVGYEAPGCIAAWAYGANLKLSPMEDEYVMDEIFGNYDGCGILWISPELSMPKDPPEWQFGNEKNGYIAEVIRFILHQTDLAQPYIRWKCQNNTFAYGNVTVEWQVYGCLVVDETYIMYSFDKNKWIKGEIHDEYKGKYRGGTFWDGKIWKETIKLPKNATDLYVVAFARVDTIYSKPIHPEIYGNKSYLRIIRERTDENYIEILNTTDGVEIIKGRIWWKSPLLHIRIGGISKPEENYVYIFGRKFIKFPITLIIGKIDVEVEGEYDMVEFYLDNELQYTDNSPPFKWELKKTKGMHEVEVKMFVGSNVYEDTIKFLIFS